MSNRGKHDRDHASYIPDHFEDDEDILEEFSGLNVRPFMQSTVVAAEYDNEFFDAAKGNKTFVINDLTDDSIITTWDKLKSDLAEGKISPRDILTIIELAVNIRGVEETGRLLRWMPRETTMVSGIQELSNNRLMTGKIARDLGKQMLVDEDFTMAFEEGTEDQEKLTPDPMNIKVKAASYLCLCMMRLMKKDPDNFVRGISSIKRGFSLFYDTSSTEVMDFEIAKASVIAISDGLRSNNKLNQTMVYHVATGMSNLTRTSQSYHLMRFAFCQHVELRGLHAYKLFYELDKVFNERLPTPVFLTWLTNDTTYKAVRQIHNIIVEYDNENKTNEYLWLYARYLNNGYFYDLHTARCRWLVYVLGALSKSQVPIINKSQGSPLDLMELQKMSKAERITAQEYADIFEENYTRLTVSSSKMNRIQREFQKRRGVSTRRQETRKRTREETDSEDEDMETDQTHKRTAYETEPVIRPQSPIIPPPSFFASVPRDRSRSPVRGRDRDDTSSEEENDGSAPV